MTTQIASSTGKFLQVQRVMPSRAQGDARSDLSNLLTPEQENTVQQVADDKIAEQIENVKSNYQTAKDIDLMQSYYQQQQKLFDIYLQTSTEGNVNSSTAQIGQNSSAIAALNNTYAELYELHQNVKEGIGNFPEHEPVETLPINSVTNRPETTMGTANQPLAQKQLDAYNSLMMPSTSSYMHLSA